MRLGDRLKSVLSQIEDGAGCVFDVGADHGFFSLALVNKKKVKRVIASDISASSLSKTEALIKHKNIQDKVTCLLSDGLDEYPKNLKADCVVIAGMGENEIIKIIDKIEDMSLYNSFILQPMQQATQLRKYLLTKGFEILYDEIVLDKNKYYSIIKTRKTHASQRFSEEDLWFGVTDLKNLSDDFINYIKYVKAGLEKRKNYLTELELKKLKKCESILKIKN